MEIRRRQRNGDADPTFAMGDHLAIAMAARSQVEEFQSKAPATKARAQASSPTAVPPASSTKPWAGKFYEDAEKAGLPVATLNAIVHVSNNRDEAMNHLIKRSSDPDHITKRIASAHARAHQSDLRSHRR